MSQWGQRRTFGTSSFVPWIKTEVWAPEKPNDTIERVVLICRTRLNEPAPAQERAAAEAYMGKTYREWLEPQA